MLLALLVAVDAALQPYVKMEGPLVLEHVRVIDGTGAPPREDQTLFIAGGKRSAQAPAGAQRVDLAGRTVMPGLVGMHDHLFYPMGGAIFGEMAYSFPRLYLAAGVTTIRTAARPRGRRSGSAVPIWKGRDRSRSRCMRCAIRTTPGSS